MCNKKLLTGSDSLVVAPGVHDALGARIAERAGFQAAYMSGLALTASRLAAPDLGLLGMEEMVEQARCIASAVSIPVIADADTGYGGALNIARTVRAFEQAGVAAIHLEDQKMPKKCGHMAGVRLVEPEEMLDRIGAACAARCTEMLIIGRTDAARVMGIDAAIERGRMYSEGGADVVFVDGVSDPDDYRRVADGIDAPLLATVVEAGGRVNVSAQDLHAMGYRIAVFPISGILLVAGVYERFLECLRREGTTASMTEEMSSYDGLLEILGMEECAKLSDRFGQRE